MRYTSMQLQVAAEPSAKDISQKVHDERREHSKGPTVLFCVPQAHRGALLLLSSARLFRAWGAHPTPVHASAGAGLHPVSSPTGGDCPAGREPVMGSTCTAAYGCCARAYERAIVSGLCSEMTVEGGPRDTVMDPLAQSAWKEIRNGSTTPTRSGRTPGTRSA
jgi:hypothetical protein